MTPTAGPGARPQPPARGRPDPGPGLRRGFAVRAAGRGGGARHAGRTGPGPGRGSGHRGARTGRQRRAPRCRPRPAPGLEVRPGPALRDQRRRCAAAAADDSNPATAAGAAPWRIKAGHGLSLVRQVADQARLTSGPDGTLATISFALGAPGPPFRLDERHLDGSTVLAVTGPLERSSAARLTAAIAGLLAQPPGLELILDLSGLTGWDSAGLAALITAQQRISASPPARMILAGLPAHLAQHLRDNGLAGRFTIADDLAPPA